MLRLSSRTVHTSALSEQGHGWVIVATTLCALFLIAKNRPPKRRQPTPRAISIHTLAGARRAAAVSSPVEPVSWFELAAARPLDGTSMVPVFPDLQASTRAPSPPYHTHEDDASGH